MQQLEPRIEGYPLIFGNSQLCMCSWWDQSFASSISHNKKENWYKSLVKCITATAIYRHAHPFFSLSAVRAVHTDFNFKNVRSPQVVHITVSWWLTLYFDIIHAAWIAFAFLRWWLTLYFDIIHAAWIAFAFLRWWLTLYFDIIHAAWIAFAFIWSQLIM